MKIPIPNFLRWYPVMSLLLTGILFALFMFLYDYLKVNYFKVETHIPVSITGVHHMGSDYRISDFYVDKYWGGVVGESGGGGGSVCCIMLPKKWRPGLTADVRWEVRHIIKPSNPATPETEETAAVYHARVPVEKYVEADRFWVHFFPQGRVRIVVSQIGPYGEQHPIQFSDTQAIQKATAGQVVDALFTSEEIAELERQAKRDRKKYGDWR
jgi:hypothetical protein